MPLSKKDSIPLSPSKLSIRPYQNSDHDFVASCLVDPQWQRLAFGIPESPSSLAQITQNYLQDLKKNPQQALILETPQAKSIGFIRYHIKRRILLQKTARMGIFIQPSQASKGFGSRGVALALRYLFEHHKVAKVNLDTVDFNPRAIRCFEKNGFQLRYQNQVYSSQEHQPYQVVEMEISQKRWRSLFDQDPL